MISISISILTRNGGVLTDLPERMESARRPARPMRVPERGAGRLKAILWTFVLVILVYVGFKVIPILVNEYQFQDGIQTIARFASANRENIELIRKDVVNEAFREDIPIRPEDIHIEAINGNVKISTDYSITVDLKVYQWTLDFHPAAGNKALL